MVGVNYHPFAGQIANNFSPFITIRGGTTFAIDGKEGVRAIRKNGVMQKHTGLLLGSLVVALNLGGIVKAQ